MMKQTKFWVLLFAALAILGVGAFLLLRGHGQTGQTAVIRVDGEVYQRIDLRAVTIPYDIEVQPDWGTNTVHVESDGVSVTYAEASTVGFRKFVGKYGTCTTLRYSLLPLRLQTKLSAAAFRNGAMPLSRV